MNFPFTAWYQIRYFPLIQGAEAVFLCTNLVFINHLQYSHSIIHKKLILTYIHLPNILVHLLNYHNIFKCQYQQEQQKILTIGIIKRMIVDNY